MILRLKAWWYNQFKMDDLERNGSAVLKCKTCNRLFESHMHFGTSTYTYDTQCDVCAEVENEKN